MLYVIEKNDHTRFDALYEQLTIYFLEADGFTHWKLRESGKKFVHANALVDDLRIIGALVVASEKWQDNRYAQTAKVIGKYISTNNQKASLLTDRKRRLPSNFLILSYIIQLH